MSDTLQETELSRIYGIMFHTAAEGLVVVDRGGIIRLTNPRLLEMFGWDGENELAGRRIEELLPTAARSGHTRLRASYMDHPERRPMATGRDLHGQRKDGSVFAVEVSLTPFEVDGQGYVMGLVTDVTRRRQAEQKLESTLQELETRVEERTQELRQAERSVREALEKERELNTLKSRFVSMASHEFRTPLSTIMSSVDLIGRYVEGAEKDKVDRHVGRIRAKVRELTGILNDFLSLDKLELGQVSCTPTAFDLPELCIGLMEEMRVMARPGQQLDYDHEGEERELTTDRQMLSNVLSNLLNNAIKYSREPGSIRLRSRISDGRVDLEVSDDGIGIPAEDQQHLFERFFRAGNTVSIQGTGLGLNIVRRYLDILGGSIRFESEEDRGTTFFVSLSRTASE